MGRRASYTRPDSQTEYFYYDWAGNLTNHTDFASQTIYSQYDALNRLTNRYSGDYSVQTSYAYTPTGQRQSMTEHDR